MKLFLQDPLVKLTCPLEAQQKKQICWSLAFIIILIATLSHWRFFPKIFRVLRWPPVSLWTYKTAWRLLSFGDKILLRIKCWMYASVLLVKPEKSEVKMTTQAVSSGIQAHRMDSTICQLLCRSPTMQNAKLNQRVSKHQWS